MLPITESDRGSRENRGIDVDVNVLVLPCGSSGDQAGVNGETSHMSSRGLGFVAVWLCTLAGIVLLGSSPAIAQTLSVEETENLVRAMYFEGMPEDEATRIGPEGAARLIEMLEDPNERASHGQILLALGLCGAPDALPAIVLWIDQLSDAGANGEIDRSLFKAWQALPFALGHLSRFDRRALRPLEEMMQDESPNWTFRRHDGPKLRRLAHRAAATSLAETGLPEARRALDRASRDLSRLDRDEGFAEHLQNARRLHSDRVREGEVSR